VDGSDVVITGAGAKEIRLKPGTYAVEARKDGKVVSRELVAVTKNGRQVVRVTHEPAPPDAKPAVAGTPAAGALDAWIKAVALLPPELQVDAVAAKLKERNPGFAGELPRDNGSVVIEGGVVWRLYLWKGDHLTDLSPVRALAGLQSFGCRQTAGRVLTDLSPLTDLKLTALELDGPRERPVAAQGHDDAEGSLAVSDQGDRPVARGRPEADGAAPGELRAHGRPVAAQGYDDAEQAVR
jgi:hypothetical protein